MKKVLIVLGLLVLGLVAIAANGKAVTTVYQNVPRDVFGGVLVASDTIVTGDSVKCGSWKTLNVSVSGMDSAYVVILGNFAGSSAWVVISDTIKANGHSAVTKLPVDYIQGKIIRKNDAGTAVRFIGMTY